MRVSIILLAFAGVASAQERPLQYVGAGSCSASACHNAKLTQGTTGGEHAFWITRDPHAKAYEILFEPRSREIQRKLDRKTPAHEDAQCLKCHVAPAYDDREPPVQARYFKTDGVSCESCHGPASEWISVHHLDAWQLRSVAEKKKLGMNDTRSLGGRAQVCVTCHVGAPGVEVNHDLIAAGHPRLHFELAAFHAHLPRHWSDAKDRSSRPDFDARLWAEGQLAGARAALELLADRAADKMKPWPEFAEFDCAACHHDLASPSARPRLGKAGAMPWGPHAFAGESLRHLLGDARAANAIGKLNLGELRRDVVAQHAAKAASLLPATLPRFDPGDVAQRLLQLPRVDRDGETQRQLAIRALTGKSLGEVRIKSYDPVAVQKMLRD